MNTRKQWAPCSNVMVDHVARRESGGWVVSGTLVPKGICPDCGLKSRRRHGWRHRHLQDFPAHGDAVTVDLRVCRWRCLGSACPRGTFSDQASALARPFAHRTSRVALISSHLGHAAGGRPAERLLHRLGIRVSDDTVLRQLLRATRANAPPATIIGIDDCSWRKSQNYGTNNRRSRAALRCRCLGRPQRGELRRMVAPPSRNRNHQPGSLWPLRSGCPPRGTTGSAGSGPVSSCSESSYCHRRADEHARSRHRQGSFV